MARIQLHNVTKEYTEHTVVKGVSLDIADGEFVVLVGPSGCGKTTTLRMIAGLEEISGGEIRIGERVVNDVAPKDRDIAMVFQSYALYPHMSVYENMAFGLRMRKIDKVETRRRIEEAASIVGLTALLARKPRDLSGGQRQRVALGRAIVREPAAFLMDEPLSNLDAQLRGRTRAEILQLHRRLKATIVYVTHDQVEAMTMGDRIVVMSDGKVQQVGRPLDVYHRPANVFVAGFIGSPAMNFIPCELVASDERLTLRGPSFSLDIPASLRSGLDANCAKELTLGIRPEDLAITLEDAALGTPNGTSSGTAAARMSATVDVVEVLGAEQLIVFSTAAGSLTARVAPDVRVRAGDVVSLQPTLDRLHVFDRAGGIAYC